MQRGAKAMGLAPALGAVFLLAALAGCTANTINFEEQSKPDPQRRPISFAIHLAYDDAQPGCEQMTSKRGEKVYVAQAAELDRSDLEVARALHSDTRSMLQLVLNYTGRRALEQLTRAGTRPPAAAYASPAQQPAAPRPPRMAVLINGELVCAPYIDRVVASGEIQIVDVFSRQECEDVAAALNCAGLR